MNDYRMRVDTDTPLLWTHLTCKDYLRAVKMLGHRTDERYTVSEYLSQGLFRLKSSCSECQNTIEIIYNVAGKYYIIRSVPAWGYTVSATVMSLDHIPGVRKRNPEFLCSRLQVML